MRPHTFVIIFISIWLGVVALVCLCIIIAGLMNFEKILTDGYFSPMILIPFGMFAFGWALVFFAFKFESKKSKEFLQQLFEATEMGNQK